MTRFGKFEVLGVLGRGGMAEVLKCELAGIGGFRKTFAVKRILPSRAHDARMVEMLLAEARLAAKLSHPNIGQVIEIDQVGDTPYIVMEYVEGPSLLQLMRRAKEAELWVVPHFLRIISDVCLALNHAHKATESDGTPLGIVHRDVSPQNILVTRDGTAKLLDFGIARAAEHLQPDARGGLKGKVSYMAPEQALCEDVGPVADVFALGCVLYQCVTGRLPFKGKSTVSTIEALTSGSFVAPSKLAPETCSPELSRLIESTLTRDPAERCPSARALHTWLESYLAGYDYPVGTAAIAQWLAQLYPKGEYLRDIEPPPASLPSGAGSQVGLEARSASDWNRPSQVSPPPAPPGAMRRGPKFWAGVGGAAAAVAALAIVALGGGGNDSASGAPVAAPVSVPEASAANARAVQGDDPQMLATYLDEIEDLTRNRKHALALELLARARALDVPDAALNIRLGRVAGAAEVASFTSHAQQALESGAHADAIRLAKSVLDRDPDSAEARAILAAARQAQRGADQGADALVPSPPGALVLDGTAGALVLVDDEPMGKLPLTVPALAVGDHRLEIRLAGYQPVDRAIAILSGATTHETFDLQPAPGSRVASSADRRARPPARSPPAAPEPATSAEAVHDDAAATGPKAAPASPAADTARVDAHAAAEAPDATATAPRDAATAPQVPDVTAPGAAVPASPEPQPIAAPALPTVVTLQSVREAGAWLQRIEREAVARGDVPNERVQNCTAPLAKRLIERFSPGQTLKLQPSRMYYTIVKLVRAGKSREAIAGVLVKDWQGAQ